MHLIANFIFVAFILFTMKANGSNNKIDKNLFKTWKHSSFYAFRGIRYGLPPIDALRFKVSLITVGIC